MCTYREDKPRVLSLKACFILNKNNIIKLDNQPYSPNFTVSDCGFPLQIEPIRQNERITTFDNTPSCSRVLRQFQWRSSQKSFEKCQRTEQNITHFYVCQIIKQFVFIVTFCKPWKPVKTNLNWMGLFL